MKSLFVPLLASAGNREWRGQGRLSFLEVWQPLLGIQTKSGRLEPIQSVGFSSKSSLPKYPPASGTCEWFCTPNRRSGQSSEVNEEPLDRRSRTRLKSEH